jgi:hypothetical protein
MPTIFYTKVVGVTFENRQDFIKLLSTGQKLQLIREPDNSYDSNAIAVYSEVQKLGYISRNIAKQLATDIDCGFRTDVQVEKITNHDFSLFGVNIRVALYCPDEDKDKRINDFSESENEDRFLRKSFSDSIGQEILHDKLCEEQERKDNIERFQKLLRINFKDKL